MSRASPRFHRTNPILPTLAGTTAMRITPGGVIDNQLWLMNFDYINTATASPPTNAEITLSNNWITNVATALKAMMANDIGWTFVKVTCLTLPQRLPYLNTTNASMGNGTGGTTHLPSEVAAIISKFTSTKGQHGRGRNYLPGVPSAFVTPATDPNRLNGTGVTALGNLVAALVLTVSDGVNPYSLGITQRTHGGAAATNGQVQQLVFGRSLLGTVRRRRIGRGK